MIELTNVTLTDYDADGFLGLQVGMLASSGTDTGSEEIEALHPYGFAGRPPDPQADQGCNALLVRFGDELFSIALNDPRGAKSWVPTLQKGGSSQYDYKGQRVELKPDDSSVEIEATQNLSFTAGLKATLKAPTQVFDATLIKLGSESAVEPALKGTTTNATLTAYFTAIQGAAATLTALSPGVPATTDMLIALGTVLSSAAAAGLVSVPGHLSQKVMVE